MAPTPISTGSAWGLTWWAARAPQRYSQQRGGRSRRATGEPAGQAAVRRHRAPPAHSSLPAAGLLHERPRGPAGGHRHLHRRLRPGNPRGPRGPRSRRGSGRGPVRHRRCPARFPGHRSPPRANRSHRAAVPSGPDRTHPAQLHELTSRLVRRQSAQAERLSYQRRGGPRQPGTRGGVFHQKISNSEHVLLALLYHRGLCTLDVLADALGGVSRSAAGNVIRETLPLLQQEGDIPGPAPTRYRTAADLLAAGATSDTATS